MAWPAADFRNTSEPDNDIYNDDDYDDDDDDEVVSLFSGWLLYMAWPGRQMTMD